MFQYNGEGFFSGSREGLKLAYFLAGSAAAIALADNMLLALLLAVSFAMLFISGYREWGKAAIVFGPMLIAINLALVFFIGDVPGFLDRLALSNLRILNLVLLASFFAYTTDVFALCKALEKAGVPEIVRLPVYTMFRFLPEIERDVGEIMAVQRLRGFSPKQPISYFKAVFVPVLYTLFERADGVGLAHFLRSKRGK